MLLFINARRFILRHLHFSMLVFPNVFGRDDDEEGEGDFYGKKRVLLLGDGRVFR
jgi:hypothetical protein